jgi:purine-binding chemotaxis protein CheW
MSAHSTSEALAVAAGEAREVLTFRLGGEEYGIDILRVQEIRSFEKPTRIAGAAPFMLGASNLRGDIVPIADLRLRFGMPEPDYGGATATVVLKLEHTVGVVVDEVRDVVTLPASQVRPPPPIEGATATLGVNGIGMLRVDDADRMIILLDIERLVDGMEGLRAVG